MGMLNRNSFATKTLKLKHTKYSKNFEIFCNIVCDKIRPISELCAELKKRDSPDNA